MARTKTIVTLNGVEFDLTAARKELDRLSDLGFRFKPVPAYPGVLKFKIYTENNPMMFVDYEIRGVDNLEKLFLYSKANLLV